GEQPTFAVNSLDARRAFVEPRVDLVHGELGDERDLARGERAYVAQLHDLARERVEASAHDVEDGWRDVGAPFGDVAEIVLPGPRRDRGDLARDAVETRADAGRRGEVLGARFGDPGLERVEGEEPALEAAEAEAEIVAEPFGVVLERAGVEDVGQGRIPAAEARQGARGSCHGPIRELDARFCHGASFS